MPGLLHTLQLTGLNISMSAKRLKYVLLAAVALCLSLRANAQEEEDNSFGGWHFLEVSHQFGNSPWGVMLFMEHENFQYKRLDCWYIRPGVQYKPLPWLKLGLYYDYLKVPDTYGHRLVADISGTLRQGNLSASIRFRYLHTWKPAVNTQDDELRSRLLVTYAIPNVPLKPYAAVELFTEPLIWRRTRHYLGLMYDITPFMQLDGFYMMHFSKTNRNPQHIVGLGLNFNL